mgnify:CR=1 FL=1
MFYEKKNILIFCDKKNANLFKQTFTFAALTLFAPGGGGGGVLKGGGGKINKNEAPNFIFGVLRKI